MGEVWIPQVKSGPLAAAVRGDGRDGFLMPSTHLEEQRTRQYRNNAAGDSQSENKNRTGRWRYTTEPAGEQTQKGFHLPQVYRVPEPVADDLYVVGITQMLTDPALLRKFKRRGNTWEMSEETSSQRPKGRAHLRK